MALMGLPMQAISSEVQLTFAYFVESVALHQQPARFSALGCFETETATCSSFAPWTSSSSLAVWQAWPEHPVYFVI